MDAADILNTPLSEPNLLIFLALALPGFISMRVYALLEPSEKSLLKDNILEAIAFGIMNAALLWPAIRVLTFDGELHWAVEYGLVVLVLFIGPAIWPFVVQRAVRFLSRRDFVLRQDKTGWDAFFRRRMDCWVIVNLKNGDKVGGYFGASSFATLHPNSGHLYLEELWLVDEDGLFLEQIEDTMGALFRPEDYDYIELLESRPADQLEDANDAGDERKAEI